MKKHLIILSFIVLPSFLMAQLPDHKPMMNNYWDLLNSRTIKKNAQGLYKPYFPPPLQNLDKKAITLPGYMVPLKTAALHKTFLLSVLPIMQCQFCGEGDIPEMVEVILKTPVKYVSHPIVVIGILDINSDESGITFRVLDSEMRKK